MTRGFNRDPVVDITVPPNRRIFCDKVTESILSTTLYFSGCAELVKERDSVARELDPSLPLEVL